MPMGIVSDEEFESEKENSIIREPLPDIIESHNPGRTKGDNNVPDSLRKIIGEEAIIEGRSSALELASSFGISPSSVSAYSNGSTSTKSMDKQPNLKHLNESRQRVSSKAMKKMMSALDFITDDKLENESPITLSSIARNMGAIIKDMEPELDRDIKNNINAPTFVFFSPRETKAEQYEHIFVQDKQ